MPRIFLIALTLLVSLYAGADVQFRVGNIIYVGNPSTRKAVAAKYAGISQVDLVAIPATVGYEGVQYSVISIGEEAFLAARGVRRISIPATVVHIGDYAFCNCFHLTAFEVAADNTRFSTESGVLFDKEKTQLIAYPVVCDADSVYTIPASVRQISKGAFYYSRLSDIRLPENLKSIGDRAFYGNSNLKGINFPASLQEIGEEAFALCRSLTTLSLPDGITAIPYGTFNYCAGLVSVKLPQQLGSIGTNAFASCEALPRISLPVSLDSLAPGAFGDCSALTQVDIPDSSSKFSSREGILFDKALTSLILYPAGRPDTLYMVPEGVRRIGERAFYTNRNVRSVLLPQSLRHICEAAFRFCTGLKSMHVPDGVTDIGTGAFQECINLRSVHLPSGLTDIADCLLYMTGVEEIEIPAQVRRIGRQAFYSAPLRDINLPDAVEEIGANAFFDIFWLQTANLGAGLKRIGEGAFAQCAMLRRVEFSPVLESIGMRAFFACWTIREMNLPQSVTEIGREAFGGCIALHKAILPPKVTTLPPYAFYSCNALRDLFLLPATPPTVGKDAFTAEPAAVRFYYPEASESLYAAGDWSSYLICRGIGYRYLGYHDNEMIIAPDSIALLVAPRPRTMVPVLSSRWLSDNPTVALVDSLGLVRGLSEGTATIWYIAQDSAMQEHRVKCVVTVTKAGVAVTDDGATALSPAPGDAVYTLTGLRVADLYRNPEATSTLSPGIYIVCRHGKTKKLHINKRNK